MSMTPEVMAELAARRFDPTREFIYPTAATLPASPVEPTSPTKTVPPTDTTKDDGTKDDTTKEDPEITALKDRILALENAAATSTQTEARDARNTLRAILADFDLADLAEGLYAKAVSGEVNYRDGNAVLYSIRNEDLYKKRFAGNAARAAKGLPELDPFDYLELENQYRTTMRSLGMPSGFYDELSDFQSFIENDVSNAELKARVEDGYRVVADADPLVKKQMQELYGVDERGLAAYFLDPQRAAPLLERQAKAAKVAARGLEAAGIQLGAGAAEEIIARGYTPDEAQKQLQEMGALKGLYQEMAGEEVLTEQQKIGAAFGYDVAAQQALEARKSRRVGEFLGGGQYTRTAGQAAGVVETGLGMAQ